MANFQMTPYNWSRFAITVLFALAAVASGVQTQRGEAPLEAHLFFVVCTLALAARTAWSFWKGRS